jgi:flagellar hook-basal body complex protein FliE
MNDILTVQQKILSEMNKLSSLNINHQINDTEPKDTKFSDVLSSALSKVNQSQNQARKLQDQFELGNGKTSLQDVIFAMHKSSMSFQVVSQARNKLISAYQEIMNTQI